MGVVSDVGPLPLPAPLAQRLDLLGQEFLAEFLGRAVQRQTRNVSALAELGSVLTRLGRFEEGLEVDRRLVELAPGDPTVHYNLACSLALLGQVEPALDTLERAFELGYDDPTHLLEDEDLRGLRGSPRFRALLARLESKGRRSDSGA